MGFRWDAGQFWSISLIFYKSRSILNLKLSHLNNHIKNIILNYLGSLDLICPTMYIYSLVNE